MPQPLDLRDARDNLYAFGKLWGSFDDATPTLGVFHGAMYGSVGDERLRPLFGYAGTGVTKCRLLDGPDGLAGGRLQMRGKETGFFYDLVSGEILDSWANPWTGETVEVFPFLNDQIGGELGLTMPRLVVGDASGEHAGVMNDVGEDGGAGQAPVGDAADEAPETPFLLPWQVYGDEVLLEWDYAHRYPNPVDPARWPRSSTGPWVNPSEHFVIYTSLDELSDRSRPSAHFRAGFSRVSPWWPWMRMGGSGVSGVMTGRLFSRTARRGRADLPPALLARIERDCPDFLELPTDWDLGPILSSWEAYARDTPPES
jgi:Protein of unknown function (DUF1838)